MTDQPLSIGHSWLPRSKREKKELLTPSCFAAAFMKRLTVGSQFKFNYEYVIQSLGLGIITEKDLSTVGLWGDDGQANPVRPNNKFITARCHLRAVIQKYRKDSRFISVVMADIWHNHSNSYIQDYFSYISYMDTVWYDLNYPHCGTPQKKRPPKYLLAVPCLSENFSVDQSPSLASDTTDASDPLEGDLDLPWLEGEYNLGLNIDMTCNQFPNPFVMDGREPKTSIIIQDDFMPREGNVMGYLLDDTFDAFTMEDLTNVLHTSAPIYI